MIKNMTMQKVKIKTAIKQILSDTITPVSAYLRVRDIFPQSILLESSDYHSNEDSYSFICLQPFYSFTIEQGKIILRDEHGGSDIQQIRPDTSIPDELNRFFQSFELADPDPRIRTN